MKRWIVSLAPALALSAMVLPHASAALPAVGPKDPGHGFPAFYQDPNGITLQPCLDAAGFCLPLEGVDATKPVEFPGNFPGEFFWWTGETEITTNNGGSLLLVLALEGAFANETPVDGDRLVFGRVRIRSRDLPAGTYRVTHPFGVETFSIAGGSDQIKFSDDFGAETPEKFDGVLGSQLGPFLRWDPAVAPAAPAGFVGDPNVEHKFVGSPNLTNFLRIESIQGGNATEVGFSDTLAISGKLAENAPPAPAPKAPTVTAPQRRLVSNAQLSSVGRIPVEVLWNARDENADITGFQLQASLNGAAFRDVALSTPTSMSITSMLAAGNHRFQVRASDATGNSCSFSTSDRFTLALFQQSSSTVKFTGVWNVFNVTGASGGTVRATSTAGNMATFSFSGDSAAWVSTLGPTRGTAEVFVDNVSAGMVNLNAATVSPRQVVFAANGLGAGNHTLRVEARSGRVDVDAFVRGSN